jgi:MFS family permease
LQKARLNPTPVILPLGLAVTLSLFGDLSLYAALVTRLDALGITLAQAGILLSINRLVRLPANPLVGRMLSRVGRRRPFLAGLALGAASTAGYALLHRFWPLLLARAAWGIAWSLINISGMAIAVDLQDGQERGRLSGLYNIWVWGGYAVGPLLGGLLIPWIGFEATMIVFAGLALTGLGIAAAFVQTSDSTPSTSQPAQLASSAWLTGLLHIPRPVKFGFLLVFLTQLTGDGVALATLTLLVIQRLGDPLNAGPTLISAAAASGVFMAIRSLAAASAGAYAGQRSDQNAGRLGMLSAGSIAILLSFGLLAIANSLVWIFMGVILGAAGAGILLAVLPAWIGDHTSARELGVSFGLFWTAADTGATIGPFLALTLAPWIGLGSIYWLCAGLFLVSRLGLRFIRDR